MKTAADILIKMAIILFSAFVFAVSMNLFVDKGYGLLLSILIGFVAVLLSYVVLGLTFFVMWRIFTSEGRKAEKIARMNAELKKHEKSRARYGGNPFTFEAEDAGN